MSATAVDVVVVYKDGVLKPEGGTQSAGILQDSARYRAHLEPVSADTQIDDDPTGWKAIDQLIGFIKDGPTESIGREHDTIQRNYDATG